MVRFQAASLAKVSGTEFGSKRRAGAGPVSPSSARGRTTGVRGSGMSGGAAARAAEGVGTAEGAAVRRRLLPLICAGGGVGGCGGGCGTGGGATAAAASGGGGAAVAGDADGSEATHLWWCASPFAFTWNHLLQRGIGHLMLSGGGGWAFPLCLVLMCERTPARSVPFLRASKEHPWIWHT